MAEVQLKAGAKIDTLTKKELKDVIDNASRDWFNQVSRGDRYRRFSATGTIASGALVIDGTSSANQTLGPAEGFVWAVQRIALSGLTVVSGTPAVAVSEPVQLFLNDDGASSLVHPAVAGFHDFGQYSLVLYPGDTLLAKGASLNSTGIVTLTGMAREVPLPLAWRLGG
jgi:hypothetical protein